MKKVSSKILLIMLVVIMVLPLKAQKSSYKNFEEKIGNYQKKLVYWSKIKGDDKKLSKKQKGKHLSKYRKKLMDIMDISKNKWNFENERFLKNLYYHKVNINKYKEIENLTEETFKDISIYDGRGYLLRSIMFSDLIIEGKILSRRKTNFFEENFDEENNYDWEYSILINKVLYIDNNYNISKNDTIKMFHTQLIWGSSADFNNNYLEKKMTGIYSFSKLFHDEILSRLNNKNENKKKYRKNIIELLQNKNNHHVGNIIESYNLSKEEILNNIDEYKKINGSKIFYNKGFE